MVTSGAYDWKQWGTQTTQYLYGDDLDGNMDFLSHIVNTGIGSENIESGAVNNPSFLGSKIITDGAIEYTGTEGVRVMQIGGDLASNAQKMVFGTIELDSTAATPGGTDSYVFTITYSAGVGCTGGAWSFTAANGDPFATVMLGYAETAPYSLEITNVGTDKLEGFVTATTTVDTARDLYWMAVGEVAT